MNGKGELTWWGEGISGWMGNIVHPSLNRSVRRVESDRYRMDLHLTCCTNPSYRSHNTASFLRNTYLLSRYLLKHLGPALPLIFDIRKFSLCSLQASSRHLLLLYKHSH